MLLVIRIVRTVYLYLPVLSHIMCINFFIFRTNVSHSELSLRVYFVFFFFIKPYNTIRINYQPKIPTARDCDLKKKKKLKSDSIEWHISGDDWISTPPRDTVDAQYRRVVFTGGTYDRNEFGRRFVVDAFRVLDEFTTDTDRTRLFFFRRLSRYCRFSNVYEYITARRRHFEGTRSASRLRRFRIPWRECKMGRVVCPWRHRPFLFFF